MKTTIAVCNKIYLGTWVYIYSISIYIYILRPGKLELSSFGPRTKLKSDQDISSKLKWKR